MWIPLRKSITGKWDYYNILLISLFICSAIYVFSIGSIYEPDTGSYLHLTIITTPVYPIFLYGFKKIFGIEGLGIYVVIIQFIYGMSAIRYLVVKSKWFFKEKSAFKVALFLVLLIPYWDPGILVANKIVSEGIAYPTFLIWLGLCIRLVKNFNNRTVLYFFTTLFLLISLRPQFNFILPVLVIALLFGWAIGIFKKIIFGGLLIILLFPLILGVFEKSYHFAMRGEFTGTANTGVQIMSLPLFIADKEDYAIYDDKVKQAYFKHIYQKADEAKLLQRYYQPSFDDTQYHHLHQNYAELSFGVLSIEGRKFLNPAAVDAQKTLVKNNQLLIAMWMPLVLDNFGQFLKIFLLNIVNAFDGYLSLLIHLLLLLYFLWDWKYRQDGKSLAMIFLFLLLISNMLLVCLVEHSIDRYFIYTRWMLPFAFLVIIYERNIAKNCS